MKLHFQKLKLSATNGIRSWSVTKCSFRLEGDHRVIINLRSLVPCIWRTRGFSWGSEQFKSVLARTTSCFVLIRSSQIKCHTFLLIVVFSKFKGPSSKLSMRRITTLRIYFVVNTPRSLSRQTCTTLRHRFIFCTVKFQQNFTKFETY